jgi:hypothetical protein
MAASTDSQGLKIAVAVFIALSVILAVTSYFLYSNGSVAEARLAAATEKISTLERGQSTQLTQNEELRGKIGVRAQEADAAKSEIDAHYKKVYERLDALGSSVKAAVQKAQQAGAQPQEVQELQDKIGQAIQSFRGETNRNYISSLDRLTEVMENLAMLTTEMGSNYLEVRHSLESATNVTKQQVDVQTKNAEASRADLLDEQNKHRDERQSLLTKVETLTKDNDSKTTEIANLRADIDRIKVDYSKEKDQLRGIISELHDKADRVDTILDHPDGFITYVDYESREVHLNVNQSMGARPQMVLSVFDARSPGIPTEKPKGTIEVTKVGERISVGRIVRTVNPIDPIRIGDIVYSAAWSPNSPTRFALIGKIDINRDGRDDREELKRMIQEAGGIVEYDLPPVYIGKETGKLTPKIEWFVTDERMPLRDVYRARSEPLIADEAKLAQRKGEVIKEARADGIRPMPIERLLNFLGYDMNAAVVGRPEAVDQRSLNRVLTKKPQAAPAAPKAATAAPAEEKKAAEMDEPADDTPKKKSATSKKKAVDTEDQ